MPKNSHLRTGCALISLIQHETMHIRQALMSNSIHHHIKGIRITLEMMPTLGFILPQSLLEIPYINETAGYGALNLHQELNFYNQLTTYFPDPFLALNLTPIYPIQSYGVLGSTVLSVNDLRELFEFFKEFNFLFFTLLDIFVIEDTETTTLTISSSNININNRVRDFFADRDTVSAFTIFCAVLGSSTPIRRITLVHDGHGDKEKYLNYFGCEVSFSAPCNSITLSNEWLDKPAPYRDKRAFKIGVEECKKQLSLVKKQTDFVGSVFQYFLQFPGYLHDIDVIASNLNITARTLRRRLNEKNTTYQKLQQSARFEMAKDYLLKTPLRISEVAELVGYSETANFARAFKKWSNGLSPKKYRLENGIASGTLIKNASVF